MQKPERATPSLVLPIVFLTGCTALSMALAEATRMGVGEHMIGWYALSAFILIAGEIADNVSTIRAVDAINRYETATKQTSSYNEAHVFISANRPSIDNLTTPKLITIESLKLAALLPFPPFAILQGIASFHAAHCNEKVRQEHLTMIPCDQ